MDSARSATSKGISSILFDADPARIAQRSARDPYVIHKRCYLNISLLIFLLNRFDVIVIGSGMGGGVLAHSLADNKKRVLLLERGDLVFTTHSLNTTRPHADLARKIGPTQVT